VKTYGGHTMSAPLRRVLLCPPASAGWEAPGSSWRDLGYFHEPRLELAREQHDALAKALEQAGAEVYRLPPSDALSLDAVYTHDASFPTDRGMILMHPGKTTRRGEPAEHARFYASLGVPVLGEVEPPGVSEGGDMVWLDEKTVLVGEGYRTNAAGIRQIRQMLTPFGVEVIAAPLPHGPGASACLHLMSLVSVVDERCALVDLPWLAAVTVQELDRRGFHLVSIDEKERDSMACNVLALGSGKLLAIAENAATNARLRDAGFEVLTYPGSEISGNGSGGPTCLTRPFFRG
jgi:N-dimethylarginine dimethylaminohydrolase